MRMRCTHLVSASPRICARAVTFRHNHSSVGAWQASCITSAHESDAQQFFHRSNDAGTFDSICLHCFRTVAVQNHGADLAAKEQAHVCYGFGERRTAELIFVPPGHKVYQLDICDAINHHVRCPGFTRRMLAILRRMTVTLGGHSGNHRRLVRSAFLRVEILQLADQSSCIASTPLFPR